jgi:hypothetical protein
VHRGHMEDSAPVAARPSTLLSETWRPMVSVWQRDLPALHGITHSGLSTPPPLVEYVPAGPGPPLPAGTAPGFSGVPYVLPDYFVRDLVNGPLGFDTNAADVVATDLEVNGAYKAPVAAAHDGRNVATIGQDRSSAPHGSHAHRQRCI